MTSDLYRIGAVSKLTDISAERLRAWERRYNLQPAHRSGKTRFYDSGQIERLKKIKALLDRGQAISQLIKLADEELDTRLALKPGRTGSTRVGLVGSGTNPGGTRSGTKSAERAGAMGKSRHVSRPVWTCCRHWTSFSYSCPA